MFLNAIQCGQIRAQKKAAREIKTIAVFFIILLSMVSQGVSEAQTQVDPVEDLIGKNPRLFETSFKYSPETGARAQEGGIGLAESDTRYEHKFAFRGKQPVTISLRQRYIEIDNTTQVLLPSRLVGFDLGIETMYQLTSFNEAYLSVGVDPSFYSDDWGLDAFKFRIPTHCYVIHRPDKKTTLIAGILVDSDFDYYVFPVVGLIYEPNDKLTFVLIPDRPSINYSFNEKLGVFVDGKIDLDQEFKVSRGAGHAILRYDTLKAGAGINYAVNDHVQARLSVGGEFRRRFQYKDSQFGKVCLRNGLYSEFKLQAEF